VGRPGLDGLGENPPVTRERSLLRREVVDVEDDREEVDDADEMEVLDRRWPILDEERMYDASDAGAGPSWLGVNDNGVGFDFIRFRPPPSTCA